MMKANMGLGLVLGLTMLGCSLPADADTVSTNDSVQTVVITGNNNSVNQSNISHQRNDGRGDGNTATSTRTRQVADVQGDNNVVNQRSETYIRNGRRR